MDWPITCWFPADFLSLQSSKELGSFTRPVAVSSRFVLQKITPNNFTAGQNTHPTLPLHFLSAKLQTLNFPPSNLQHSNHWNPKITELLCVPKNDKLKKIQYSRRRAYLGSLPGFEVPWEGPSLRTFQDLGYLDKGISWEPSRIWGYFCVSWGQPIWRTFQGFGVPQVSWEGPVFISFHDLKYLEYLETGPFWDPSRILGVSRVTWEGLLSWEPFMIWSTYIEYLEKNGGFRVSLSILRRVSVEKLPRFGVLVTSIGTLQYTTCP